MGIDVDPEFIIGKGFNNRQAVEDWLQEQYPEAYAKFLLVGEEDLVEFVAAELGLYCTDVSSYTDSGYVIGFEVYNALGDETGESVRELWKQARDTFGDDAKRHFWARYW